VNTPPQHSGQVGPDVPAGLAERVVAELGGNAATVVTAESLTAGLVVARLADVPGASSCVLGGFVTYATDQKTRLLGVPREVIATYTVVSAEVALAMAEGALRATGADLAVATTGAAGPAELDGHPPGTVFVALATAEGASLVRGCVGASRLRGGRAEVREATVDVALRLIEDVLSNPRVPHT